MAVTAAMVSLPPLLVMAVESSFSHALMPSSNLGEPPSW
ncbi:Uncharacterised protein [uncultured Blautia sp.]|nr:Uncharacterised protein [uncultured Blautia sp.]